MRTVKLFVFIAVASLLFSCAGKYEKVMRSNDSDLQYKTAFEYFNEGRYRKSAELFEHLILLMQGLPQEDTVQYYNALSNYKYGDYITAESNFEKFINVFPRSPFYEEAQYLRINCLYKETYRYELDPTPTRKAMTVISEFMYENPSSKYYTECDNMMKDLMERLDKKSLESAKLYYKMEDYLAARYALKNVLRDNADNIYREDVLYYTAMASYKYALNSVANKQKERYLAFIDDYYNFIGEYPESELRPELDAFYKKAQDFAKKAEQLSGAGKETSKQDKKESDRISKEAMKEVRNAEKLKKHADKVLEEKQTEKAVRIEKTQKRDNKRK